MPTRPPLTPFALSSFLSCGLTLALLGCAGQNDAPSDATTDAKAKAAQALIAGNRPNDPCADNGWYSDGECDSFCAEADADCTASDPPVACTLLSEVPNGVCGRPDSDPCRFQDPDCVDGGGNSGDGVVCALFIEVSDGVCSRPANDPCKSQDPDCVAGSIPGSPGCGPAEPTEPVVCALFIEVSDGVCSRPANDPCIAQDPDCDRLASSRH